MKWSVERINKTCKQIAYLSIVIIIFACISPLIFTANGCIVDFTETGQIGDTIGGIMNPIVALAGVFVTFIAFLMQVAANKIQSEQIVKSFNIQELTHLIESRNALELLSIDVENMLKEVDALCVEIDKFCEETNLRPTGDIALKTTSHLAIHRYKTIDRNLLFYAFQNIVKCEDKRKKFHDVYSLLDFYSEAFNVVYNTIYAPRYEDIMSIKNKLPDDLDKIAKAITSLDIVYIINLKEKIASYKDYVKSRVIKDNVMDVFAFVNLLNDSQMTPLFSAISEEYKEALSHARALVTQNKLLVSALKEAAENLKYKNRDRLQEIYEIIDECLEKNTAEEITKKFISEKKLNVSTL